MYRVIRDFWFIAAHHVEFDDVEHQCTAPHEHQFTVRVELRRWWLDRRGMVLDFRTGLDPFAKLLSEHWDGRYLNELIEQPTSERIARTLRRELRKAVPATRHMRCAVSVSEAPDVWAGCGR